MIGIAIVMWPLACTSRKLGRLEGLVMLMIYVAYVYYLLLKT